MNKRLDLVTKKVLKGKRITPGEAVYLSSDKADVWDLVHGANAIRRNFMGNKVHLCSIINAKSGNCAEDCKFCAQSIRHKSSIKKYPLVKGDEIKKAYLNSKSIGADGFSIVTSGNQLSNNEISFLADTVKTLRGIKGKNPYVCASVGYLGPESLVQLKKSGLSKCHHNLETSRRHFGQICSTHSYDERIETVLSIKKAGLSICSGGIFGIGETWPDRIDLAFTLKELDVDSVPLNFLIPIKGTTLDKAELLSPREALKIIALFRYILPDKDIRICAGREKVLRGLQSMIFNAGATGMMIGGYLTQQGRSVEEDLQMLRDLGMTWSAHRG